MVFTASALLGAQAALADETVDPFALTPEQLFSAEVISVSRSAESVWESPAAVFVITAADMERAGVTSIPEALRLAPGVQVARINTSGWAISVRGFNSALANKLLVLVDGRETYDPLFSGVYWDVQDTALEDIDRIEIVRGPGASLWGANAVNGVINIITRRAEDTQGWLASVVSGNAEEAGVTLRYGAGGDAATQWRVFGRAYERGAGETPSGGDDNSDWRAWRGGFRVDSEMSADDRLTVQGDIYQSETGQLRLVSSLTAPFTALERETIEAEGANLLVRWTHETDNDGVLTVQSYLDLTARDQRTLSDRRTTFDLDVQYDFPSLGSHEIIAGVRYRYSSDDITPTEIIRSETTTHRSELLSAFVQDQITLAPAWRLTVGSKFDQNDYTGFEVQPNARLQWSGERQMAWASVSRALRSPSELDREFDILLAAGPPFPMSTLPLTIELLPSPEFESEEVLTYELGYRRQITRALAMDVALFHSEYDGLATLTPLAPQLGSDPPRFILIPIVTTNDTRGEANGGEVVLDWRLNESLGLSFAYSSLDISLDGPPGAINAELAEGQSPANQANLRLQWDATDRLAVDAAVYYVDELPALAIESYVRADLRIGYRLTDRLQLDVIGQNVFDDWHREFTAPGDANAAAIGRSVFGRLTWRP
ncbi:TonB-dependent receptor plug domain-containing protein [Terricaulis silvestris]|uniref:TonB-dependent receptor plug domain-containing protein n=1 Tax=Terricaulis silvestris TaxID=2686094 RepID=UPI00131CEFB6|nr:TonB-dependent receptor [Terricaulis silvestris]